MCKYLDPLSNVNSLVVVNPTHVGFKKNSPHGPRGAGKGWVLIPCVMVDWSTRIRQKKSGRGEER